LLNIYTKPTDPNMAAQSLELALREGVVPADAGVGSNCLAGDWAWDPLDLASKDYILQIQSYLLRLLPSGDDDNNQSNDPYILPKRPTALILRDYREAEIRHGRLAMLAAMIWPLQEMLDNMLLEPDQFGPLLFGPITLPYFPLFMTLCMLLLGYLDIYAAAIKDRDEIGEAFLPGDLFWDPLSILEGAPATMKRNMQERELFNGRVAMLAIAAFLFEEGTTHLPLIEIEGNDLLLEPAYQVPFIQEWLDLKFAPAIYNTMMTMMTLLSSLVTN
jgi:light-harvesting complex I chlorophyll a/b binding protein 1